MPVCVNSFLQKCLKKKQLFLLYLTMFFQISASLEIYVFRTVDIRAAEFLKTYLRP